MKKVNIVFDLGQGGSIEYVAMNLKRWMLNTDVALVDFRDPDPRPAELTHYLAGLYHHIPESPHQQLALVTRHHLNLESPNEAVQQVDSIPTVTMSGEWHRFMLSKGARPELQRLIPHGVDLDYWSPKENKAAPKFTIGIVAHSYSNGRKGEELIPEIFKLLHPIDIRLVIVGKGWANIVEILQNMGVKVEWRESVSVEALWRIYQDCSVYLCTSYVEGGPLPLLEAMAMGVTPVSTPVGLARDILPGKQLGYLFPKGSALQAASTIQKLYYGHLKLVSVDRMREALQLYTWKSAAIQYERFYEEIIETQGKLNNYQQDSCTDESSLSAVEWLSLVANPLPTDLRTQPLLWRGINRVGEIIVPKIPKNLLKKLLNCQLPNQVRNGDGGLVHLQAEFDQVSLPVDSHLSIVDDQGVVFVESTQQLVALNTIAAFIWCCFEDALGISEIVEELEKGFLIQPDKARSYIDTALTEWKRIGLINPQKSTIDSDPGHSFQTFTGTGVMPPLPDLDWSIKARYRLVDTEVDIFLENADFDALIQPVIGHLKIQPVEPSENSSSLVVGTIHVCLLAGNVGIYRDQRPVAYFPDVTSIAPTVNSILLQMAVDGSGSQFYFHTGLLSDGKQLVMLPGAAGSGKSTLTAGLMRAGLTYYTDEVALFSPDDPGIRPFPVALCSKSSAWSVLETLFAGFGGLPDYHRLDGKRVRYQPPEVKPLCPHYDRALPVGFLVFPKYGAGEITEVRSISRVDALQRLMNECLAIKRPLSLSDVEALAKWIGAIDCYELPNSSLDESVAAIISLFG